MNILILTSKFGLGHYSAAEAIKEKLLRENSQNNIKIIDFFEYMFPKFNKAIYGSFNFLVNKCCTLYNILNKLGSHSSKAPLKKIIVKKIDNLLIENQAELIISVFPVCSQYISAYKKIKNNKVTLNTCITDIEAHEEWISKETDLYYVPSLETKLNLIEKGVTPEKIIISGIPVKTVFNQEKQIRKQKNILIMGGGLGLIPSIDNFLHDLEKNKELKITIVTGNNQKMYKKLNATYKNIKIIGFTNEVANYMKDADLIVTKSGGVTMFEAINSETPLFVIKPFLKQELGNALFIEDNNIGEVVWNNKKNVSEDIIKLINNSEKRKRMICNMKSIKNTFNNISFSTQYRNEEV